MPVLAIDIHVATNGDDNHEGTKDAPLLTIQMAMEIVQPGDRILVHEGTYMITVYNLQGQRVNEPAQKGIYIKNGKKYIAKWRNGS